MAHSRRLGTLNNPSGFRGNDREGLGKLEALDPGVQVIDMPLTDCYRCPAPMTKQPTDSCNFTRPQ
jgi:hypothetical protein